MLRNFTDFLSVQLLVTLAMENYSGNLPKKITPHAFGGVSKIAHRLGKLLTYMYTQMLSLISILKWI